MSSITHKMNPKVKARWVAALLSGKYKQGKGVLRTLEADGTSTYCCFGVLTDLFIQAHNKQWEKMLSCPKYTYNGHPYFPTQDVLAWAGLPGISLEVKIEEQSTSLNIHNDGDNWPLNITRKTFEQIAQAINEQL